MSEPVHSVTVRQETLPVQEKNLAVEPSKPTDLLSIIAQVASRPEINVEAMRQLLEMQERIEKENRRVAFMDALARIQAQLTPITKHGQIKVGVDVRSTYARVEDIDKVLRPLLAAEGMAFSFDEEETDGKTFKISCRLSHKAGHFETKRITLPLDSSGSKNSIQGRGSTQKYGQRYLIKMHLNIMEEGEDTDGVDPTPLTGEEVKDLNTAAKEVFGNDLKRFLVYMKVGDLAEILKKDLKKAYVAIDLKRDENAKKAAK